jgi:hypothetical protein
MRYGVVDVAIVGAGPYGLSLGAHLKGKGVAFRIFGQPMQAWHDMPRGMFLKSLGFATNVFTPDRRLSFVSYCQERGLESVEPCSIADFARYGVWVQEQLLPELERVDVRCVSRAEDAFTLTLSDGSALRARQVVVAVGIKHFARTPRELATLPIELASHTSHHRDYDAFVGKDVCVIGGGQSALEAARLLLEAGARPKIIIRDASIGFSDKMSPNRGWWERLRRPQSGLGPGLKNWVLETLPLFVHFVPDRWRVPFVKTHLGPHGAWWVRGLIEGKVPVLTRSTILEAVPNGGGVALRLRTGDGARRTLACDHVIAGTGYEIDIDRLDFMDAELRLSIRRVERGPILDHCFQSSVSGLYFVGPASTLSFGPLFRFVTGAAYTSRALSTALARRSERRAGPVELPPEHTCARAAQ